MKKRLLIQKILPLLLGLLFTVLGWIPAGVAEASGAGKGFSLTGFLSADRIARGSSVILQGKLTSASNLTKVELRIYDRQGQLVQTAKAVPGSTTYQIKKLSSQLAFETLSPGEYIIRLYAAGEASGMRRLAGTRLKVEKNRNRAERLIRMAEAEIGTSTPTYKEDTKYEREVFGSSGNLWCASFVSWCAKKVGIKSTLIPRSMSTLSMAERAKKNYHPWDFKAWGNLKRGDVIFFSPRQSCLRTAGGGKAVHHVGIVQEVDKKRGVLYTVEGNVSRLRKNGTADRSVRVVRKCLYHIQGSTGKIRFHDSAFFNGEYICGYIAVW